MARPRANEYSPAAAHTIVNLTENMYLQYKGMYLERAKQEVENFNSMLEEAGVTLGSNKHLKAFRMFTHKLRSVMDAEVTRDNMDSTFKC